MREVGGGMGIFKFISIALPLLRATFFYNG
jgi:hypothetical protein